VDKKDICACGLTCCDCLFHKEGIYETAAKLKEEIKNSQLDVFLNLIVKNKGWNGIARHLSQDGDVFAEHFKSFEKLPAFMEVLDGIINLQCKTTCSEADGCSIAGDTHQCATLLCCKEKGFVGCWECDSFENCDKLTFLKMNYGDTIEGNLKIIRDHGIGAVKSRSTQYYAWQKKSN